MKTLNRKKTMKTRKQKNEIWKKVKTGKHTEYYVSNYGNCMIKDTKKNEIKKIFKGFLNQQTGYMNFINEYVHRLVAKAFLKNEHNFEQVDHINSNRTDNRLSNLRWTSRYFNNNRLHAKRQRRMNHQSIKHYNQIIKATKDNQTLFFKNGYAAANALSCSHVLIYNCLNKRGSARLAKGYELSWVNINEEK